MRMSMRGRGLMPSSETLAQSVKRMSGEQFVAAQAFLREVTLTLAQLARHAVGTRRRGAQ